MLIFEMLIRNTRGNKRDFEPTFGAGGVRFENEIEMILCVSSVLFLFCLVGWLIKKAPRHPLKIT
jgi:hypothetical protein